MKIQKSALQLSLTIRKGLRLGSEKNVSKIGPSKLQILKPPNTRKLRGFYNTETPVFLKKDDHHFLVKYWHEKPKPFLQL